MSSKRGAGLSERGCNCQVVSANSSQSKAFLRKYNFATFLSGTKLSKSERPQSFKQRGSEKRQLNLPQRLMMTMLLIVMKMTMMLILVKVMVTVIGLLILMTMLMLKLMLMNFHRVR